MVQSSPILILHISQIHSQAGGVHHWFGGSAENNKFRSDLMQTQRCSFNRMQGDKIDGQMGKKALYFSLNFAVSLDLSQPVGGGDEESDDAESSETKAFYAL